MSCRSGFLVNAYNRALNSITQKILGLEELFICSVLEKPELRDEIQHGEYKRKPKKKRISVA